MYLKNHKLFTIVCLNNSKQKLKIFNYFCQLYSSVPNIGRYRRIRFYLCSEVDYWVLFYVVQSRFAKDCNNSKTQWIGRYKWLHSLMFVDNAINYFWKEGVHYTRTAAVVRRPHFPASHCPHNSQIAHIDETKCQEIRQSSHLWVYSTLCVRIGSLLTGVRTALLIALIFACISHSVSCVSRASASTRSATADTFCILHTHYSPPNKNKVRNMASSQSYLNQFC